MSKIKYVLDFVEQIVGDKVKAQMVVERLTDEGLLHLGYGDADVDIIINKFTDTFGTTKVTKTDRWAAQRLAKKYGSQAIVGIVGLLGKHSQEKYAPVVGNVTQLEEKIVNVLSFLRNTDGGEEINA